MFRREGPFAVALITQTSALATAPSARAQEPQSQQQYDRSDRGVDDEANDFSAEMKSKAMQEPVCPLTILPANHPAMTPTTKMTSSPWSDRCMLFL